MAIITDKPEDLTPKNDLDDVDDPDQAPKFSGERAEIYLSGSHVCTLDDAPSNRQRITMMVDLEVFENTVRANGDEDVPIRKCRRIGDMYLPGTERPPSKEEIAAMAAAAKARAAAEQAAKEEAERAEREHNEPPMFTEGGDPNDPEAPADPADDEDQGDDAGGDRRVDPAAAVLGPAFSDAKPAKK